jgi:tetratricopeptide (TPR) repeat protein
LGRALWRVRSYEQAISTFRKGLERAPGLASIERELAWGLATCPQVQWRNGPEALEIATRLCRATSEGVPRDLDILAAAQAETGDFAGAIESESKSIALMEQILEAGSSAADDPRRVQTLKLLDELRSRLELYRLGQPYRDES